MRHAVFVLLLLAAPALFAQSEDSPRQVLDACIDTLGSDVLGLEAIEAACPGLGSALERLDISALLSGPQRNLLTRKGLINLRTLVDRYEQPPRRAEVSVDGVHTVLESMRKPVQAEHSQGWLERFRRWLREVFDKKQDQESSWLRRWLDEHPISEVVQRALFYAVILLVLVLAIVIIVNEIRAARVGRHRKQTVAAANHAREALAASSSHAESRGARASALLRSLIATLVKTGRLHGAPSLTHRELTARAKLDDPTQRESFRRVTRLAEQEVFGGQRIHGDDLEQVIQAGERLNAQLNGATP